MEDLETSFDNIINSIPDTVFGSIVLKRIPDVPAQYKKNSICAVFECVTKIEGKDVVLHVGLTRSFPFSLPVIYLYPVNSLGYIPHVSKMGIVCYTQGTGQYIEYELPHAIIEEALRRAIHTLKKGLIGSNKKDFLDGFAEYWGQLPNTNFFNSVLNPGLSLKEIALTTASHKGKTYRFIGESKDSIIEFSKQFYHESFDSALYIPLSNIVDFRPPAFDKFWSLDEVHQVINEHATEEIREELQQLVKTKKVKEKKLIVFGLPRYAGGFSLFGIFFTGLKNKHPLLPNSKVGGLHPISFRRLDKEYLFPRGGSSKQLDGKKVAVIGCGSVGGHIAIEMAKAGVLNLTLIDADILNYDNVLRHALGNDDVGSLKVEGLKRDLEKNVPFVKVRALGNSFENLILTKQILLDQFDMLIFATGEPTTNLFANNLLHQIDNPPKAIFTWLDPYGIGGHAFLQENSTENVCLKCLYQVEENELRNRVSFAEPGQNFLKDISGCGSLFTPFSSLDAIKTAEIAVRLCLESLANETGNQLRSWKGDSKSFLDAGYFLSPRYSLPHEELNQQSALLANKNCSICKSKSKSENNE